MKLVSLLVSLLVTVAVAGEAVTEENVTLEQEESRALLRGRDLEGPSSRIINGQQVSGNPYKWYVALQNGHRTFCGASVLNSKFLLTAAHCVKYAKQGVFPQRLVIGTSQVNRGGIVLSKNDIKRIVQHPAYGAYKNDVALIELKRPLPSHITPIKVAKNAAFDKPGQEACVAGFGYTKYGSGIIESNLREACMPLMSLAECKAAPLYSGRVNANNLCMLGDKNSKGEHEDSCSGDSGSAQFVKGSDGEFIQIGVVSWGRKCGVYPGVYMRISAYARWIQGITGSLPNVESRPGQPEETEAPPPPATEEPATEEPATEEPAKPEVEETPVTITCGSFHGRKRDCLANRPQCNWNGKRRRCRGP